MQPKSPREVAVFTLLKEVMLAMLEAGYTCPSLEKAVEDVMELFNKPSQAVIVVDGGVVTTTAFSDDPNVEVTVIDLDNFGSPQPCEKYIEGQWVKCSPEPIEVTHAALPLVKTIYGEDLPAFIKIVEEISSYPPCSLQRYL